MKLGFFTMPLHPVGRDWRQTLAEDREAILLAEQLGFEEAFIGEHLTDLAETITSCLIFIASLARDTTRIKLGSGTVNLPNNHPVQVASKAAMLDHMLEGRFIFGIGPGGLRSDMEVCGNLDLDRNAMFVESINHILALWAGEPPYNLKGQFWNISTERTLLPQTPEGRVLLQLEHFGAEQAAALVWVNPQHVGEPPDEQRGTSENALAMRWYARQGTADVHLFGHWGEHTHASVGAALAWVAGDELELPTLPHGLEAGRPLVVRNLTHGTQLDVRHDLDARAIAIAKSGGLLRYAAEFREEG